MSALENIKKALDGATPGPWKCVSEANFDSGLVYTSVQPVNGDDEAMKPLAMANGEYHVCRMSHSAAPWRFNYHRKNAQYIAAVNPVAIAELLSTLETLREASANLIASASDTYKKRNGHLASFEDDSGEKCWIVPFDAFESLRSALPSAEPAKTAPPLGCERCNGTGKEARHQICRDCDEATPSFAVKDLDDNTMQKLREALRFSASRSVMSSADEHRILSALSAQVQEVAVAEIVSKHGDPETFGERELVELVDIQKYPYGTKLYAVAPAKQEGQP